MKTVIFIFISTLFVNFSQASAPLGELEQLFCEAYSNYTFGPSQKIGFKAGAGQIFSVTDSEGVNLKASVTHENEMVNVTLMKNGEVVFQGSSARLPFDVQTSYGAQDLSGATSVGEDDLEYIENVSISCVATSTAG